MSIAAPINAAARLLPARLIYILCAGWVAWLFYLAATGGLGVEPINALEREYGNLSLKFLVAGLMITPLRRFAGINLIKFRRAIGVSAFFLVLAHLLVWAVLDVQNLDRIWADIVKRPYVTVGMTGFLLLLPLAVTSNNWSARNLGPKWRQLHKLTYPAAVLAAVHFIWLAKGFQIEPLIWLVVICGLLAARLRKTRRAGARAAPSGS
ncbi:MAG: protein-methionine-sulfoxide reductase heme-binding subunit MsrQ [Sediminimonas qiaohouensis]|uniref:Protein-methionine-sulfoxide reductase heme-binding subunit MsrQ n=1 Tax=Sediminimonas qiaohouensis TaxID=552061 RepID=A0A7C9HPJ7_9RHOB|nr:protein-methionine-sulfoxide reductase heme-binding subunit MsrQ [Sediminimonas qiaohouensis]MTJ05603.1 protein-methionine-sulfoxide reductase heme-binding subunit MsrQ [Sediminimonas qiaohouensis]